MTIKEFLFWQPKKDYFNQMCKNLIGKNILVSLNYIIWIFLFYISYLLVKNNINIFWQLLLATIISEIVEKYLKTKKIWYRPVHQKKNAIPNGLIKHWYKNGSFPSGHTIKAVFFFLFILRYPVFSPILYWTIVAPLLFSRIILGLHYPIDVYGGAIIGVGIYLLSLPVNMPSNINNLIQKIFNFIFYVH